MTPLTNSSDVTQSWYWKLHLLIINVQLGTVSPIFDDFIWLPFVYVYILQGFYWIRFPYYLLNLNLSLILTASPCVSLNPSNSFLVPLIFPFQPIKSIHILYSIFQSRSLCTFLVPYSITNFLGSEYYRLFIGDFFSDFFQFSFFIYFLLSYIYIFFHSPPFLHLLFWPLLWSPHSQFYQDSLPFLLPM